MAYELDFATDGYFNLPAIAFGADFKVEVDLKTGSQVGINEWIFNSWDVAGNNKQFVLRINNSQFQSYVSFDGVATIAGPVTSTITTNTLYNVVVEKAGAVLSITLDGGTPVTQTVSAGAINAGQFLTIGRQWNATFINPFKGILRGVQLDISGTPVNYWNANSSSSAGTGTILYDDVGTDDLTQLGTWPAGDSEWVFYSDTTALELTPTVINSNSQSFNPTLQYASLLSLTPGVVDSASSPLNPVIQYSASLLIAPSVVDSASSSLNPALQYASVVLLEPATVNSSSSALNPNISFSAALNMFPATVDSASISLDPVVKYISALDLLPGAVNSNSVSLDPVVNYTSILNISPSVVNSNSVSFNPSIDYTSALILSPVTVDSSSVSLDPLVEYKAVINITSQLINSASVSLNPSISTGATQDVGTVTAGFAADLYSVKYQPINISVNFKG